MNHRQTSILAAGTVLLAMACSREPPSRPGATATASQAQIQDAVHHQGAEHFFWLPPLVPSPAVREPFDGSLSPVVEICEWAEGNCAGPLLARFTTAEGSGSESIRVDLEDESYVVNWHTDQAGLDATKTYRIRVLVDARELGHADVRLASGRDLKNLDTDELIALRDGRTLPIKFRIERRDAAKIFSACREQMQAVCSFPPGELFVGSPLVVDYDVELVGARSTSAGGPRTKITSERGSPVVEIPTNRAGTRLAMTNLIFRGGVRVQEPSEPCAGIGTPEVSPHQVTLTGVQILGNGTATSVVFSGHSLVMTDVTVGGGLYVKSFTGSVVLEDVGLFTAPTWGAYICNPNGGVVFVNGASFVDNGTSGQGGGLAVVNPSGPNPSHQPACIQGVTMLHNKRVGAFLFGQTENSLLFDIDINQTVVDNDGHFGDGIQVVASPRLIGWDVSVRESARLALGIGDCLPGRPQTSSTVFDLVGQLDLADNLIDLYADSPCGSQTSFSKHSAAEQVFVCNAWFTAPPTADHCFQGGTEYPCKLYTDSVEPPPPLDPPSQ